jgi:hypothetical protein
LWWLPHALWSSTSLQRGGCETRDPSVACNRGDGKP